MAGGPPVRNPFMDVEPANINQVISARDGRFVEVDGDVGGVVQSLKAIDPRFRVRFAEAGNPPYWVVYTREPNAEGHEDHLVLTQKAHQTNSGVWTGLDHRIVHRVMEIAGEDYDYLEDLERTNNRARKQAKDRQHEKFLEGGEIAAHALRKDLAR